MRKLPKASEVEDMDSKMSPARKIMKAVTKHALNPKKKKSKKPAEGSLLEEASESKAKEAQEQD